jgi:hypothetical protein
MPSLTQRAPRKEGGHRCGTQADGALFVSVVGRREHEHRPKTLTHTA